MRDIVEAVSTQFQTPRSMAAVNAIGVVAASIGTALQIRTYSGGMFGNLYLVAIAKTATGKSRVSKALVSAFERLEDRSFEEWKLNTKRNAESEKMVAKKRADRLRDAASKQAGESKKTNIVQELNQLSQQIERCDELLIPPKYICQDTTEPELARLMMQNKGKMFLHDGEARAVLSNVLGKHEKDGETGESVLLKGFSSDTLRTDRIGRGAVRVKTPCITLCISVQPDKFQKLIASETMHESGFIPRLLVCDTHAKAQAVTWEDERSVSEGVQATWDNLIERLFEQYYSRQDEPLQVRCASTAQKLFAKFQNEHVENVNNGISDLPEGYALRSAEKAFRVALALHAVEHEYCARKELSEQTASNAIKIVRWFDTQASALLQERMQKESEREVQRIFKVATKPEFAGGFTSNHVLQYTKWQIEKCDRMLEDLFATKKLSKRETRAGNGKKMIIYSAPNHHQWAKSSLRAA